MFNDDIYDLSFIKFDAHTLLAAYIDLLTEVEAYPGEMINAISLNRIPNNEEVDQRGIFWIKDERYQEQQREKHVDETAYTELIPEVKDTCFEHIYNDLSEHFVLGRLRVLLLEPRTCLSYHRDPEARLHIPILTNPGCLFVSDDFCTHLPADGRVYYTNTQKYHTALNGGESDRVHLVATICGLKNEN